MYRLQIAGDFVIQGTYEPSLIEEQLVALFNNSDFNIINLEAPVTSSSSIILKTGPNLKSDETSTKNILEVLNVSMVTLANNHILDYDEQGVADTLSFCNKLGIQSVGAGMNLKEAAENKYIDTNEGKIAIVNFAENEWASATDKSAGANPMDIIDNLKQIHKAKEIADFVIVIIHGGHEYYNLPSPRMQKQYRFYADQGVDLVVGHHTHCISGYEVYKNVPIYYSLGNFLFTEKSLFNDWYQGMILQVNVHNNKLNVKYIPVQQERDNFKLQVLSSENEEIFKVRINHYNKIIADSQSLKEEWLRFIEKQSRNYLNRWSVKSFIPWRFFNTVLNRLNINLINRKGLKNYLNYMRCEAHYDLSKDIITKYLKE